MVDGRDQTDRFIDEGIWEHGFDNDRIAAQVRSMRMGERIAIKAAYIRKHNLPFDNAGHTVLVMAIKATGVIAENSGDGRQVRVHWQRLSPPREWYFYTYQATIWKVSPGDWKTDALIAFTFADQPQDLDRFRNDPFWRERFGIGADSRLGQAFRIGHSYVTPHQSLEGRSSRDWFAEVVASELKPLLHEYWFDAPEQAEREAERLLEGW